MAGKIRPLRADTCNMTELRALIDDPGTSATMRKRAEIVLLRAEGIGVEAIAARIGVSMTSIVKWPRRYSAEGIDGLRDLPTRKATLPEPAEPGPPEAIRIIHWF